MSAKRWLLFGFMLLIAAVISVAPAPVSAQKAKKEDPEAEKKKAEDQKKLYLKDLMMAYRLKELGQDKNNPSPESLITAARLFRRLSKVQLGKIEEKPEIETDDKDAKPVDEAAKPPDLEEEARDLLDQARALSAEKKLNLDAIIRDVEKNTNTRATVGGPKQIARRIGPRQTQVFHFNILGRRPWYVAFQASGPLFLRIHHHDGTTWDQGVTPIYENVFYPGGNCHMVIRVHNPHHVPGMFQLFSN